LRYVRSFRVTENSQPVQRMSIYLSYRLAVTVSMSLYFASAMVYHHPQ